MRDIFPPDTCLGIDLNGKKVFNGKKAFRLVDTSGLPLDMTLQELDERGWVIDWTTFIMSAALAGWNPQTIFAKIEEALFMVYRDNDPPDLVVRLGDLFRYLHLGL